MTRARTAHLRTRLSRGLVGLVLVSVLLLSSVNYVFARRMITDSSEAELSTVRDSRVETLQRGVDRLRSNVSTLAANPSVVDALSALTAQYDRLEEAAPPAPAAELEALYESEVFPPFDAAGVELGSTADFVPASTAGRYVQHHYIAENPDGFDERDRLDDAGDGSGYSTAHAAHHPLLRELMDNASMSDLLLVAHDSGEVVYSTKKRIDLGTNVTDGPYADTGLGEVLDGLSAVAAGETVVSDSWFYVPTHGSPVFFLGAAVRSGSEVIGAIVTEVPVDVLTAVTTADQDWELLGLGRTGDAYIVGEDRTLRTDSRRWLDDPDDYLGRFLERGGDAATAELIEAVGSPVLLHEIDNRAVAAGLDGDEFVGTVTNHLGIATLTAAAPVAIGELDWVVIAEQSRDETDAALDSYIRRVLLMLAVLVPVVAAIGMVLARNLTRPVNTLVDAADRIADGEHKVRVDDLGQNELGDLGRQLEAVARHLEAREREIADEEQRIIELMSGVLPPRLVDRVRQGEGAIDDIVDTASVISITLDDPTAAGAEEEMRSEIAERMNDEVDDLMARHGVERVRRSSGSQLFIAGLGEDDERADEAVAFAIAAVERVAELGAEFGHRLDARAGVSAGAVATGVLGEGQLTFGVWGDPPTTARTLGAIARPGQVLVDGAVGDLLGPGWEAGPSIRFPGVDDEIECREVHRSPAAGRMPAP